MEQTRALNALEPFLALSKSATSPRAAADLVTQATSAQNTYVFAELLQTRNIQNLRESSEYSSYLTLLEIFSWGTWANYNSTPNLPKLSPAQEQKLRLLSLLPLSSNPSQLTYPSLQKALSLPSARALEDLIITAIYSGLVTATLNPAHSSIAITSVAPLRDLSPGSVPNYLKSLDAWGSRCDDTLKLLDEQVAAVKQKARDREMQRKRTDKAVEEKTKEAEEKGKKKGGVMEYEDEEMLDAMEENQLMGGARSSRSGRRGLAGFGAGRR